MRPLYLAAVVGTRLISVLALLILAHLMKADSFGAFAMVVTNALAIQMLFGSWLASLSTRLLVNVSGHVDGERFAGIATAMYLILSLYGSAATLAAVVGQSYFVQSIETIILAGALLLYELSLSVLNATGSEHRYAAFALTRNCSALAISCCLVMIGGGAEGAVTGQIVGVLAALLLTPAMLKAWLAARPSFASLGIFTGHLRTAMAGSITLGIYVILNAPIRNVIAFDNGLAAGGVYSLCGDLFYGPLNLLASAYILSKLRLMYLSNDSGQYEENNQHGTDLLNFAFLLAIPYAVGGFFFGSAVAELALPADQRIAGAMLAPFSAAQGSLILILYCLATVALVRKRLLLLVFIAASASILPTACILAWGGTLRQSAEGALGGLAFCVSGVFIWSVKLGVVRVDMREVAKILLATLGLTIVSAGGGAWFGSPWALLLSAVLGTIVFLLAAVRLKVTAIREIIPDRLHRYIGASRASV